MAIVVSRRWYRGIFALIYAAHLGMLVYASDRTLLETAWRLKLMRLLFGQRINAPVNVFGLTFPNAVGLAAGLEFELFRPSGEQLKDFYAELPIQVQVTGEYHDFGRFEDSYTIDGQPIDLRLEADGFKTENLSLAWMEFKEPKPADKVNEYLNNGVEQVRELRETVISWTPGHSALLPLRVNYADRVHAALLLAALEGGSESEEED